MQTIGAHKNLIELVRVKAAQRRKHKHGKIIATSPEAGGSVPGHPDWTACGPAFTAASRFGAFPFQIMNQWFQVSSAIIKSRGPQCGIVIGWLLNEGAGVIEVECTHRQMMEATGLSERNVETGIRKASKLLSIRRERIKHKTFYSISQRELMRLAEGGAK